MASPMSDEPYRAGSAHSEEDAELARLAAEGQRKIDEAAARNAASRETTEERTRDDVIRAAIGAHFGSGVRRTARVLFLAIPLLIAAAVAAFPVAGTDLGGPLAFVFGMLALACFVTAIFLVSVQPMASRARVAAERAWSTSLPFALDGYFDLLAMDDCSACHILVNVQWGPGRPAELALVEGAAGALDPDARAQANGSGVLIRSTAMPMTYLDRHRNRRGTNRQLAAYTHALVDRVLVPIHKSHPIARITLGHDTRLSREEHSRVTGVGVLMRKW
jgi:hypothetical protein